jgi:hypothetical protein
MIEVPFLKPIQSRMLAFAPIARNQQGQERLLVMEPRRCKHGMLEGTCSFCLGSSLNSEQVESGPPPWFHEKLSLPRWARENGPEDIAHRLDKEYHLKPVKRLSGRSK